MKMQTTRQNAPQVMVVGSITVDVSAVATRPPAGGETVFGSESFVALGGKGANQAVAAARAGAMVSMVGAVGDDMFGPFVVERLRHASVDTTTVAVYERPTGLAHIRIDGYGQNDIVMVSNANAQLTAEFVDDALRRSDENRRVLLTQLEIPIAAAVSGMRTARELGMLVILDPAPWVELPDEIWELVDVVTPNESEASRFTGLNVVDTASAAAAGAWFCARGVGTAIITMGASGSVVVHADSVTSHPAVLVKAVDTTAAGDTFTGFLGSALASGASLDDAVARAMHAAALSVTRHGASPSIPTAAEVADFMQSGVHS
ncbi:MAG: ribokinase [Microbacterium sp.]